MTLGDHVNITARLASEAGPGQILISEAAYFTASLNLRDPDHQQLELKRKSEPIGVRVLHSARDEAGHLQIRYSNMNVTI